MNIAVAGGAAAAAAAAGVVAEELGVDTAVAGVKNTVAAGAAEVKKTVVGAVPPVVVNAAQAAAAELWALYEYPPVAFYFYVVIGGNLILDNSFMEVSGITTDVETEDVVEGGNQYVLKLPTKIKHANLVLKRGSAAKDGSLVKWCKDSVETDFYRLMQTKKVSVYLMNAMHIPIQGWDFFNAYPVKWEFEPFNSMENKIAIEKIELSYLYSKRVIG